MTFDTIWRNTTVFIGIFAVVIANVPLLLFLILLVTLDLGAEIVDTRR